MGSLDLFTARIALDQVDAFDYDEFVTKNTCRFLNLITSYDSSSGFYRINENLPFNQSSNIGELLYEVGLSQPFESNSENSIAQKEFEKGQLGVLSYILGLVREEEDITVVNPFPNKLLSLSNYFIQPDFIFNSREPYHVKTFENIENQLLNSYR